MSCSSVVGMNPGGLDDTVFVGGQTEAIEGMAQAGEDRGQQQSQHEGANHPQEQHRYAESKQDEDHSATVLGGIAAMAALLCSDLARVVATARLVAPTLPGLDRSR